MKRYGLWRYLLILLILGMGIVYSLPNLYAPDPAVQISYTSSSQTADEFLAELDEETLNMVMQKVLSYVKENNAIMILVEHDFERAMQMADRLFTAVGDKLVEIIASEE